jgi:hypothetical protein
MRSLRRIEGINAPARAIRWIAWVGAAFARPLKGRISKCRDKGADGINIPVLEIKAAVGLAKVDVFKNY